MTSASEILEGAAAYIEEHGLSKGAYFRHRNNRVALQTDNEDWSGFVARVSQKGCRACALGGMEIAAEGSVPAVQVASTYLEDVLTATNTHTTIPTWNDAKTTTQDQVVAAIRQAARAAREDSK